MNKTIGNAVAELRNNPTDTKLRENLITLAVPKFKEINNKVQDAVKTINRHLDKGKGMPNRAKIATVIGFLMNEEYNDFREIGNLLNLKEMTDRAVLLAEITDDIDKMRKNRAYTHIDFLPDFLTNEEIQKKNEDDAKQYLYNIVNAVNRAVNTINRHIAEGDFNPNTFKIAKAMGYFNEIAMLRTDFTNFINANNDFATEIKVIDDINRAIKEIITNKTNDYINGIKPVTEYDPFPEAEPEAEATENENKE